MRCLQIYLLNIGGYGINLEIMKSSYPFYKINSTVICIIGINALIVD